MKTEKLTKKEKLLFELENIEYILNNYGDLSNDQKKRFNAKAKALKEELETL